MHAIVLVLERLVNEPVVKFHSKFIKNLIYFRQIPGLLFTSAMAAQASSSRSGNVVADVSMDPNIWSNLPWEITKKIFGWLPFREFFQKRMVCKEWNRLASDPHFLEASFTELTPKPYFVVASDNFKGFHINNGGGPARRQRCGLLGYDASSDRWNWTWLPTHITSRGCLATEGLIFNNADLKVFNLHTRVIRTLPEPPGPSSLSLPLALLYTGMMPDRPERNASSFQIFLGHDDHTLIYNSRSNSWTRRESPQLNLQMPFRAMMSEMSVTSCAHCNGFLYITEPLGLRLNGRDTAMGYDLERGDWFVIKLPVLQDGPGRIHFLDFHFGAWQGRLFVVGFWNPRTRPAVKLWELRSTRKDSEPDWEEVVRLPELLCDWLKIYSYHSGRDPGGSGRFGFVTPACCFCGEYVLVYTSWVNTELLPVIKFVMFNLQDIRKGAGDPSKWVWKYGWVPYDVLSSGVTSFAGRVWTEI